MRFAQFAPSMPGELPPARRQIVGPWIIDLDEFRAKFLRPHRKDSVNAVTGKSSTKQARCRQSAPRRFLHVAVSRGCVAQAAVAAKSVMMAIGGHRIEICGSLAFGRDNGSPPLVTHC